MRMQLRRRLPPIRKVCTGTNADNSNCQSILSVAAEMAERKWKEEEVEEDADAKRKLWGRFWEMTQVDGDRYTSITN